MKNWLPFESALSASLAQATRPLHNLVQCQEVLLVKLIIICSDDGSRNGKNGIGLPMVKLQSRVELAFELSSVDGLPSRTSASRVSTCNAQSRTLRSDLQHSFDYSNSANDYRERRYGWAPCIMKSFKTR